MVIAMIGWVLLIVGLGGYLLDQLIGNLQAVREEHSDRIN